MATQKYLETKARNLAFFKSRFPAVFKYFSEYAMRDEKLDVIPAQDEVNLVKNGECVYTGGAYAYSRAEAEYFLNKHPAGRPIRTTQPPIFALKGELRRFATSRATEVLVKSPLRVEDYKGYDFGGAYPLLVFMGVGVGAHISAVLESTDVPHAIVVEDNLDRFAASLYTVDWALIFAPFDNDSERSLDIVLRLPDMERVPLRRFVMTALLPKVPLFPFGTIFYNHLSDPRMGEVISSLNDDIYSLIWSFGSYDDEMNHLNNARHNFAKGVPLAPAKRPVPRSLPWCIVGSGPSLDARIDELRMLESQAVIVSCGTAISALKAYGIKPDIQVELESAYALFEVHEGLLGDEFVDDVLLLGAAQLTPQMFDIYKKRAIYFRDGGTVSDTFGRDAGFVARGAHPTCTNAALAIAAQWNVETIFMFGMDFGFASSEQHHSRQSSYYQGGTRTSINLPKKFMTVPGASGGTVQTTSVFFAAKQSVENTIIIRPGTGFLNCSDGAAIEGSEWVANVADCELVVTQTHSSAGSGKAKGAVADAVLSASGCGPSLNHVSDALWSIAKQLEQFSDKARYLLRGDLSDNATRIAVTYKIAKELDSLMLQGLPAYSLVKGSVWLWILIGFSHGSALLDSAERQSYLAVWRDDFDSFLANMVDHFKGCVDQWEETQLDPKIWANLTDVLLEDLASYVSWELESAASG